MAVPDFANLPIFLNLPIFAVAAAVVWYAGSKLAAYADAVAKATGINYAIIGMVLLGGITSLPEIAVTVSAGLIGDAELAVGSIFGSVTLQVVIIAIADAMLRDRPLTYVTGSPTVLMQGTFCCMLLAVAIVALAVGDVQLGPVGAWSTGVFVLAVAAIWITGRYRNNETWRPIRENVHRDEDDDGNDMPLGQAVPRLVAAALAIVVAGYVLARTGEAIAGQTGLGSTFVGTVLVGFSTSLPEISTVVAAVRLKKYLMAFSDIFGTNIFDLALLFVADVVYAGPPVFNEIAPVSIVMAAAGIIVTLIYMAGLIERRDRQMAGLGPDSWGVVLVYIGSVSLLYFAGGTGG